MVTTIPAASGVGTCRNRSQVTGGFKAIEATHAIITGKTTARARQAKAMIPPMTTMSCMVFERVSPRTTGVSLATKRDSCARKCSFSTFSSASTDMVFATALTNRIGFGIGLFLRFFLNNQTNRAVGLLRLLLVPNNSHGWIFCRYFGVLVDGGRRCGRRHRGGGRLIRDQRSHRLWIYGQRCVWIHRIIRR